MATVAPGIITSVMKKVTYPKYVEITSPKVELSYIW
jgi:hypothetical protein